LLRKVGLAGWPSRSGRVQGRSARVHRWRYVRGVAPRAPGGEADILDAMAAGGAYIDPATQLVALCEVCGRPSNKECWICKMRICDFCTRKQHWRGAFALHWPLVNARTMLETLGKKEMEKKRIDDARRYERQDPNFRTEAQLKELRRFKEAAFRSQAEPGREVRHDRELSRYWMWAETDLHVIVACYVPTGYSDKELDVRVEGGVLTVQPEDSPAIIRRRLAGAVDRKRPAEVTKSGDNRLVVLHLPKAELGEEWGSLFEGDPRGARRLVPAYRLFDDASDAVVVEVEVPRWVEERDVHVRITGREVSVWVNTSPGGGLLLDKVMFIDEEEARKKKGCVAVDPLHSSWGIEDAEGGRLVVLTLALPEPDKEDVTYRQGQRRDHRTAERPGEGGLKGMRFFADDEDEFGLEDILEAAVFLECGSVRVPHKPWEVVKGRGGRNAGYDLVRHFEGLSKRARAHALAILDAFEASLGEEAV